MLFHRFDRTGVLAIAAAILLAPGARASESDQVHWTITGPTSVSFFWRSESNLLRYGPTTAYGTSVHAVTPNPVPVSSAGPFWEARLTGLAPNTVYHYAIGSGGDHVFRTPPPRGASDFVVYAIGDIGSSLAYWRVSAVQSQIASGSPRFVLALGDLTYGDSHGPAAVDRHFDDMMAWSRQAAYMPVWGNHDWDPPDSLDNYKGRFDLPNSRTSPGAPTGGGEDWYWFDYGNTRFIAYPEPWSGAWADWYVRAGALMDSAQADTTIDFVVTFGHRPAYSSGHHSGSASLKNYLDALGSAHSKYVLNLNAHSHNYERTHPRNGVTHITSGGGGAHLEAESGSCMWAGGCPAPTWSAFRAMRHAPLRLRFTQHGIEGSALCGPAGGDSRNPNDVVCAQGTVLDTFVIGTSTDRAPVVTAPAAAASPDGQMVSFDVQATDPNGDAILSLVADLSSLPAGNNAAFRVAPDRRSGTFTWTPVGTNGGPYTLTFRGSNGREGVATTQITVDPAVVGPNLVGNPSFESGTTGWSAYHGASIVQVPGGSDGAQALRVAGPATLTADFGVNDSPNWIQGIAAPGTRHRIRAWVRSDSSRGTARLQVREYLGAVQQSATTVSPPVPLTADWQMLELDYVNVVQGSTLDLQILDQPLVGGESFLLDGVAIGVIPTTVDVRAAVRPALRARFTPNPTRTGGAIGFDLAETGEVRVEILDLVGRRVRSLGEGRMFERGSHRVHFDGRGPHGERLAPGLYFFRVSTARGHMDGRFLKLE